MTTVPPYRRTAVPALPPYRLIRRRIFHPTLPKPLEPKQAGLTAATGCAVRARVVARQGNREVQTQGRATLDDLALGELDQRSVDADTTVLLHTCAGGKAREVLKGSEVLRPAIGV